MNRNLSLITPTGRLTLGNHLGAFRSMVAAQAAGDCYYGVSDLHAMTTTHDPAVLRSTIARGDRPLPRGRPRSRACGAVPTERGARPPSSWPTSWSARRTRASWVG